MVLKTFLTCFIICFIVYTSEVNSEGSLRDQIRSYLKKYGYIKNRETRTEEALADYQKFVGIEVTGSLDASTRKIIQTPRCGNKDKDGNGDSTTREKRYAVQGSRWEGVTDLTYRISKYPGTRLQERNQVDEEIARAFKAWSEQTPLNFSPKKSGPVHIDIRFEKREHGDHKAFDGPGKTLAHAFYPQYGGNIHFDDEEEWTINVGKGIDLFWVATHEIGHSLGLNHSDVTSAVMTPTYKYVPNLKLHKDDILGITTIYGSRPTDRRQGMNPQGAPDLCASPDVDAVTKTADGSTYVFKGKHYWLITRSQIANGYPRLIQQDWGNLPADIDAVLPWTNGKTFFFKGDQYWSYTDKKGDSGYPKNIRDFITDKPFRLESTLQWVGEGITPEFTGPKHWSSDGKNGTAAQKAILRRVNYFLKRRGFQPLKDETGYQYWRYTDKKGDSGYPKNIRHFINEKHRSSDGKNGTAAQKATLRRANYFLKRRGFQPLNDEMIDTKTILSQENLEFEYLVKCPKLSRGLHEITYVNKWVVIIPK